MFLAILEAISKKIPIKWQAQDGQVIGDRGTNKQWNRIEPIILATPPKDLRGRKERDTREVINGILWILRTGAPWKDLPPSTHYTKHTTVRFQQWVGQVTFQRIAQMLAQDLYEQGGIDIREAFIDWTFVPAKKGFCCRQDKARQRHQDHGDLRH